MTIRSLIVIFAAGILAFATPALAAAPDAPPAAAQCGALKSTTFGDARIQSAVVRAAGPLPIAAAFRQELHLPAICRVEGVATPSGDSEIHFEVWLPIEGAWNGKLMAVGNGGYDGSIYYWEMAPLVRRGFAVVGGDTGHTGSDPDFGKGHIEKIKDWGDRSIHVITVTAKQIAAASYGKRAEHSYFSGCSTGGHQALTEAQRYPLDFDGIIAGAPGNNRTHLNAAFLWMGLQNRRDPRGKLLPENLKMISQTVLKICDAKDGLKDGIVADPRKCKVPPETFSCRNTNAKGCLNPEQVKTLALMYQGPRDPRTGAQIYPPFTQGSESGWEYLFKGDQPYRATFWTDWVFDDPNWSPQSFDWDHDMSLTDHKLASIINANDPDLSAFKAHGGKLIMYQGWIDPIVSVLDTIHYYDAVTDKVGGKASTRDFARLFLVPDMGHCGPFGTGDFGLMPVDEGGGKDVVSLLDNWVEKASPPARLVVEERKQNQTLRTRVACAYPDVAVWNHSGSPDDQRSFACRAPKSVATPGHSPRE